MKRDAVKHYSQSVSLLTLIIGGGVVIFALTRDIVAPVSIGGTLVSVVFSALDGTPAQIVVVAQNGTEIHTDENGIVAIPGPWFGKSVSIREPSTWVELITIRLPTERTSLRIVLPLP